ncbi:hypothetical protein ZWY2020_038287 [Hordeum vulgare]|nr:hypothetical protein ZWY2020_038287 [Hordeum vulgare]
MVAAVPTLAPTPAYDNDIVYECMPCIRIYKNCVQHYFSSEFFIGAAAIGVASCDRVISLEVSTRLYPPHRQYDNTKLPVLVYYHGGRFCLGSAFNPTFHAYFNNLAMFIGFLVIIVEYHLTREHPIPAAYTDSWDALACVVSHVTPGVAAGFEPWLANHAGFACWFHFDCPVEYLA